MGALILNSCNEGTDIGLEYQLTAKIDIMNVVKYVKDIDGSALFENGELRQASDKIVLSYAIYNESGELVTQEESSPSNFAASTTITKSLKQGTYSIITCAYIKGSRVDWWTINDKSNLRNCKIKHTDTWIGLSGVLGYSKESITINKSETLSINVPSAVSLFTLNFDYLNLSGISKIMIGVKTWNDFLSANDGEPHMLELLNDGYVYEGENDGYRNILMHLYYLPTPKTTILWAGYDVSDRLIRQGTIPSISVVAGRTYITTIDTNTGEADTEIRSAAKTGSNQAKSLRSSELKKQ